MRLDLFLKTSRLITRRSLAQDFCDAGRVFVNSKPAKSSKEVNTGDEIRIIRGNRSIRVKVLAVPASKQVSKTDAAELFEMIGEEFLPENYLPDSTIEAD